MLCGGAACQFEIKVIRIATGEDRQRLDACYLAASELSDEDAIGRDAPAQMFRHGAEIIVSDRGRNLAGGLQNVSLVWVAR